MPAVGGKHPTQASQQVLHTPLPCLECLQGRPQGFVGELLEPCFRGQQSHGRSAVHPTAVLDGLRAGAPEDAFKGLVHEGREDGDFAGERNKLQTRRLARIMNVLAPTRGSA
jgi:hypothetical protein